MAIGNNKRLVTKSVTILTALEGAFADPSKPTSAELNKQWDWVEATENGINYSPDNLVHNITCALYEDDNTFELDSSDTDDGLTYCDDSGVQTPTTASPSIEFSGLRDADKDAHGKFNEYLQVVLKPDITYYAILRVQANKDSNDPFEAGDIIRLARVSTDNPVDNHPGGEVVRIGQTPLSDGFIIEDWAYKLEA